MPFWFFTSYARADRDPHLKQFIADLCEEVRRKNPERLLPEQIGFFDTQTIEPGDEWEPELADALRTSRLCVALCSPRYLDGAYCGKEYQVFCERHEAWLRDPANAGRHAQMIFPVLWEWLVNPLPNVLSRFQYFHDKYPDVYLKDGLRNMMKLSKHKDDYFEFVDRLARTLVHAGAETPLPDLPHLRPLSEVPSAFSTPEATPAEVRPLAATGGPNSARFVFVAAKPAQLQTLRTSLDCYGDEGGWYWRPYHPTANESVGILAQAAALKLKLRYLELPLGDDLVQRLRDAESQNEAVVILTDIWTIGLDAYGKLMREYDEETLANCAVLVPWNDDDPETSGNRTVLEHTLQTAFPRKFLLRPRSHYWDSIRSARSLRTTLERALNEIRMMVIGVGEAKRRVRSEVLARQAEQQGIAIETKPNISGPGGGPR